jgi:MoaA/NifB/PqqE/SkfB family radical SAM enzyme
MAGEGHAVERGSASVRRRRLEVMAGIELPALDGEFVEGLLDPSKRVGECAARLLAHRYPWLLFGATNTAPLRADVCRRYRFGEEWGQLRAALARAARQLPARPRINLRRFNAVPGLLPDLMQELAEAGRRGEAERVSRWLRDERHCGGLSKQILFAITYACNLRCSYCYAKNWEKTFPGHMPLELFRKALDWCCGQGLDFIILGGGEPTVHPAFGAFVAEARSRGVALSLTSNGLFGDAVRPAIAADVFSVFVCHVEQDIIASDTRLERLLSRNIAAVQAAGVETRFRYTLTPRSDSRERRRILALAREHGIQTVNYGFAFQNADKNNESYRYERLSVNGFDTVLNRFMDEAHEIGVELHLSKPVPLCYMRRGTLRRMAAEGGLRMACTAARRGFSMNVTVNPDLSTLPCNALNIAGPKITEFRSVRAAGQFHAEVLRRLYRAPWRPKCRRCVLHHRGLCQGVCLAERVGRRPGLGVTNGGSA